MLIAIESLVSAFERLLAPIQNRGTAANARSHADNDNSELSEDESRWAAYR